MQIVRANAQISKHIIVALFYVLSFSIFCSELDTHKRTQVEIIAKLMESYLEERDNSICGGPNENSRMFQRKLSLTLTPNDFSNKNNIFIAILAGNSSFVKKFIFLHEGISSEIEMSGNFLQLAAAYSNKDIMRLLIEAGIDINSVTPHNIVSTPVEASPLIIAISLNQTNNALWLINSGANVNSKKGRTEDPLYKAISCNNQLVVNSLIVNGAVIRGEHKDIAEKIGIDLSISKSKGKGH